MRVGGTKLHESISAKNYIDAPRRRERMSATQCCQYGWDVLPGHRHSAVLAFWCITMGMGTSHGERSPWLFEGVRAGQPEGRLFPPTGDPEVLLHLRINSSHSPAQNCGEKRLWGLLSTSLPNGLIPYAARL